MAASTTAARSKCAVHDLLVGRRDCGGSTLTQQLAKNFFLTPDKTITRKIAELMITYQLEARFNKQQIFEMYANEMNMGHRGSYEINGVGEALADAIRQGPAPARPGPVRPLPDCSGTPATTIPTAIPTATMERRNLVLDSMVETGAITRGGGSRQGRAAALAETNVDAARRPTSSTWCTTSLRSASATRNSATTRCASTPRWTRNCSAPPPRRSTPA
jgi:penicillin-binding protein 1B